ncbi:hypothetical protein PsYK624_155760 [Phanerochaete sordida]|uniref:Uncharacterized protein n=1 Tax=Phanerochaete sordida TaxID=48140 RepID=A0A9P3GPT9_9APHY|nr:hypothetical protein PsYK624_155760 [Phanerochaete sordida]
MPMQPPRPLHSLHPSHTSRMHGHHTHTSPMAVPICASRSTAATSQPHAAPRRAEPLDTFGRSACGCGSYARRPALTHRSRRRCPHPSGPCPLQHLFVPSSALQSIASIDSTVRSQSLATLLPPGPAAISPFPDLYPSRLLSSRAVPQRTHKLQLPSLARASRCNACWTCKSIRSRTPPPKPTLFVQRQRDVGGNSSHRHRLRGPREHGLCSADAARVAYRAAGQHRFVLHGTPVPDRVDHQLRRPRPRLDHHGRHH